MEEKDFLPRHELALWFSKLLMVLLVLTTASRPLIVTLDPVFTWIGLVNIMLAIAVFLLVRTGRAGSWEGCLVIAVALACITPLLFVSGGVNSQFAYLIPIFPLGAGMLGGRRLITGVCGIWLVLIVALALAGPAVPDITGEAYHRGKSLSRAFWLLMALCTAGAAGLYFQRAYQRLTRQLHEQATFDHLTGVVNRRAVDALLDAEIKRMCRSGNPLSVMMVDVDRFKEFNDRHGHAAGDECLVAIADCLRRLTRDAQDVVGRYGGEEFLVVLTDTNADTARRVAEKLRKAVSEVRLQGISERVSVTIGLAGAEAGPGLDREALVRRADQALYEGKTRGRNRVVWCSAQPAPGPAMRAAARPG